MTENTRTPRWTEPAWIRKLAYAVLSLVLVLVTGAGLITDAQADSWLAGLDQVITVLGAVGLGVAAAKTHRGSDDRTTARDIVDAQPHVDLSGINAQLAELRSRLAPPTVAERPGEKVPEPVDPAAPGDYRALSGN